MMPAVSATEKVLFRCIRVNPDLPKDMLEKMALTDLRGECPCGTTLIVVRGSPRRVQRVHKNCAAHAALIAVMSEFGLSAADLELTEVEIEVPADDLKNCRVIDDTPEAADEVLHDLGLTGDVSSGWWRTRLIQRDEGTDR